MGMRIAREDGQTTSEYTLIVAGVIVTVVAVFTAFSSAVREHFERVIAIWPG
jgi:Flp pilus assembly pilin Flp